MYSQTSSYEIKKRVFGLSVLLLLLLALPMVIVLVQRQARFREYAQVSGYPARLYVDAVDMGSADISEPENISVNKGDKFRVNLFLSSNGVDVGGVDVVLKFDRQVLQLTKIEENTTYFKTFAPVVSEQDGTFDRTRVISRANETGRVEVGAVTFDYNLNNGEGDVTGPVNGNNILLLGATFRAVDNGESKIAYVFRGKYTGPGDTSTDSNVSVYVEKGCAPDCEVQDVLGNSGDKVVVSVGAAGCREDLNADGDVNIYDVLLVIDKWGECAGCREDLNADGDVNIYDVLLVIDKWGEC